MLMTTTWVLSTAWGGPSDESSIRVVVADNQGSRDNLVSAGSLSGGTIRLVQQDNVVLERSLDHDGRAAISVSPGNYILQAFLESNDPGCFWGNTIYDLELPLGYLEITVFQICSGS